MTFSWLEKGQGTPLVLLHGIGSAARSFSAQLDGLASRWRVIAWDAPGYGQSEAIEERRSESYRRDSDGEPN